MRTIFFSFLLSFLACGLFHTAFFAGPAVAAAAGERLALPPPDKQGGKPLMECLALRRSTRSFSQEPLALQDLSNLLWATFGLNRPDGRRTAPTARNTQEVLLLVVRGDGVWRYEGREHALVRELSLDARDRFGGAPVTLLYAAPEGPYAGMHVGSLYQNAGLYCASAGLANVVKGTGVSALNAELRLPKGYRVLIVQSVGRPG